MNDGYVTPYGKIAITLGLVALAVYALDGDWRPYFLIPAYLAGLFAVGWVYCRLWFTEEPPLKPYGPPPKG